MERRVGHKVPPLVNELLAILRCEEKCHFSERIAPDKLVTLQVSHYCSPQYSQLSKSHDCSSLWQYAQFFLSSQLRELFHLSTGQISPHSMAQVCAILAMPLLDMYPKDSISYRRDTCSFLFFVALFTLAEKWKEP